MTGQNHATKQQHWVPQFYLKGWSSAKDQIYCFDKSTQNSFSSATTGVSGGTWFYDTENTKDETNPKTYQIVERFLADLEGKYARLFEPLRAEAKTLAGLFTGVIPDEGLDLTQEQRTDLSMFMSLQFLRTDDVRSFIRTSMNAAVQEGMEATLPIAIPDIAPSNFRMTVKDDEIKRIHIEHLLGFPEYAPYFFRKWWCLGVNPHKKLLVTSDNPIVKVPAIKGEDGLDSYAIRLVYPVSPYLVLTMYDVKFFPPTFNGMGFITEDTVEQCNLLQLQQCRRQIYSAQSDFDFAQTYCKDNPHACIIDAGKAEITGPIVNMLVAELLKVASDDKLGRKKQK